jgi:uncharacterized protein DUF4234
MSTTAAVDERSRVMNASRNTGPLGKERGVASVIVFSIITLGIYYLVWVYKSHEEIKEHSGEGVGGVLGLVIALVVGFVTPFVLPSEIRKMYERDGKESGVNGWTGLWATLGILILVGPIVWFVKVQGALNRYWRVKGGSADPAAQTS